MSISTGTWPSGALTSDVGAGPTAGIGEAGAGAGAGAGANAGADGAAATAADGVVCDTSSTGD